VTDVPIEIAALDALAALSSITMVDQGIDTPVTVYGRMLAAGDPDLSIGVFPMGWQPVVSPGIGSGEPDIGRYNLGIATMLKSVDRLSGERLSAIFVKRVRTALYRHKPLLDDLRSLSSFDDESGLTERYQKSGVTSVDYASSQITGGFVFVSQTEFFIETEVA
jgi:hypothetical protein